MSSSGRRPSEGELVDLVRRYVARFPGERATDLRIVCASGREVVLMIEPDSGHSADFRSFKRGGVEYSFTASQSHAVRLLFEAEASGSPDVGGEALLEAAGSEASRARDLFKDHPAWGQLIVPGQAKGTYRLAPE